LSGVLFSSREGTRILHQSEELQKMAILIIFSTIIISCIMASLIALENFLNRNDEFPEVKEWHNFRSAFDQSNKGEK
jgi:hypothetical protein